MTFDNAYSSVFIKPIGIKKVKVIRTNILLKAAQGDAYSIEELCLALWEPVYRFIYHRVQNREEAEDITQESFARTLAYFRNHGEPPHNVLGYLKTVGVNIIRDSWRKRQLQGKVVNWEDVKPLVEDNQTELVQRLRIESALERLKPEQKTVLQLRILMGCSVADTARQMGKSEAAVRTCQYRALQTLARYLDDVD